MEEKENSLASSADTQEGSDKKLILERAEVLFREYQSMLQRNNGLYPPTGEFAVVQKPSPEDEIIMDKLRDFFEDECSGISSIELGDGIGQDLGGFESSELKILSDNLLLLETIRVESDIDVHEFHFITKEKARGMLQEVINERRGKSNVFEEKNRQAMQAFNALK